MLPGGAALALVLLVALAARVTVALQLDGDPLLQPRGRLDSAVLVDLARLVAGGDLLLYEGTGGEPFFLAPLYPYVLGLLLALSGGSLLAAKLAQAALGTLAVGLLHAAARPWVGRRAAVAAAALLAASGPVVFHETLLLQSALDPLLVALSLLLVSRALLTGGRPAWAAVGVALGLFTLNRPNALVWAAALAAVLPLGFAWRRGAIRSVALLLGLGLVVAPVTARNVVVSGEPVLLTSHGGLNLYIGNNADADGTYHSVPGITPDIRGQVRDARRVAEESAGRPLSVREVDAHFRTLALDWMARHPLDAASLFLRKLAYVFSATEITLNHSYAYFSRDEPTLLRWLFAGAGLLVPLGLLGLADRLAFGPPSDGRPGPEGRDRFWIWALVVPAYAVSAAAFFVSSRYRLPLLVPLAAGAGFALLRAFEALRRGERRRVAAYVAALVPLVVLAYGPHGLDDGRAAAREDRIVWDIESGRVDEALALLTRAEEEHPGRAAVTQFRAGRALQAQARPEAAVPLLERSLARDPGRAEVRYTLGQCLLDLHRPADAEPHLRAAFAAGVRPDLSGFDLARALAALDRTRDAVAVLEELLPLALDAESGRTVARLAVELQAPELGLRFLDRALAEQPDDAATREQRGLTLATLGRVDEARLDLTEAVQLDPRRASAPFNLALLEARSGRLGAARDAVDRALALRPDYPQALALREQLGRAH